MVAFLSWQCHSQSVIPKFQRIYHSRATALHWLHHTHPAENPGSHYQPWRGARRPGVSGRHQEKLLHMLPQICGGLQNCPARCVRDIYTENKVEPETFVIDRSIHVTWSLVWIWTDLTTNIAMCFIVCNYNVVKWLL